MIQIRPSQDEERSEDAAPRHSINVVYAGSGPATFLSTGLSYELEPDIDMPPVTHPQGLWVVPAAEFPVSLPGQRAPLVFTKPQRADLLDVPEGDVWPSEAPDERLLRYTGDADEIVLLTTPEYEEGWRRALGSAVVIAVLRGLTMPDGAVADARIEIPAEDADRLADLPAILAQLAGRDSMEEDAQQVDLLDTAQPLLQQGEGAQIATSGPQEAAATAEGAQAQPDAQHAPAADKPTSKLRAQVDARRAAPKKSKPPFFPPIPKYPGW